MIELSIVFVNMIDIEWNEIRENGGWLKNGMMRFELTYHNISLNTTPNWKDAIVEYYPQFAHFQY